MIIWPDHDLDDILACVHPDNAASIRVLENLGFVSPTQDSASRLAENMPVYRIDRKTYTQTVQP